jgi:protein SCO1
MMLLVVLLALLSHGALAGPPALDGIEFDQRAGARVPLETTLRTETGQSITLRSAMAGRPTILALGYYHCTTLCGVVRADLLNALSQSGLRAGTDYTLLVASIDPSETPAQAEAARAQENARYPLPGSAAGIDYLTGDAASLESAVGFHARFDDLGKQFLHPAGLVFLTPGGTVSGYLLGVGYRPSDLRAGVMRAADGGIAAAPSPILLLCFHVDPATGRYTLEIMRVVRLSALLTLLTVGGTILLALRRERR